MWPPKRGPRPLPCSARGQKGAYWYALATAGTARCKGLMSGLMEHAAAQAAGQGCRFLALIPAGAGLFPFYAKRGFEKAFGLRRLQRPIKHNLWAQADFDAVTAKSLLSLRAQYLPGSVQLGPAGMVEVLTDLYRCGVTIVSSDEGYGLYFKEGDALRFIELAAVGDRAAELLLEAAREKTGAARADITLGQAQNLFLGEGAAQDYGMVRFLGQPMDVSQCYMRLMMDDEPGQG